LATWTQDSHPRRTAFREDPPAMGTPDPVTRYRVRAAAAKAVSRTQVTIMLFLRPSSIACAIQPTTFGIAKAHSTSRRAAPKGTTSPGPSNEMPLKPTAKLSKILSAQPPGAGTPSCPADRACQIDRGRIPFPFAPANGIRNPSPVHLSNSAHPRQGRTASIPTGPIPVKALPGRNRISLAIDCPLR